MLFDGLFLINPAQAKRNNNYVKFSSIKNIMLFITKTFSLTFYLTKLE